MVTAPSLLTVRLEHSKAPGRHLPLVPEVNQSTAIQLPFAKDGIDFLQNILYKIVEQVSIFFLMSMFFIHVFMLCFGSLYLHTKKPTIQLVV